MHLARCMEGDSIEKVLEDHIRDVFEKKTKLPLNFYVLDVLKFIHDRYSSHLSSKDPTNEGYDLLLTDSKGKCLSKVLLGASDCPLAQKQILVPGCEIIIKSLSWQSNIHDSGIRGSYILPVTERIELLAPRENGNPPPQFDAVRSTSRYKECQEHPLFSCRKYYISQWSSIDPPIQWVCTYPQETAPSREDLVRNAIPLSDVVEGVSSAAVTFYGSVIGRVLNKSNIIHFAKPSDQYASPYPFQFYVELSDGTQSVPVVFWNGNCLQWYSKVNVGDVLLLSRFTVKEVSDSKAKTHNRLAQLRHPTQSKQVDINLNCDRSPLAVVHVLPTNQLPSSVSLPEVSVTVNTVAKVMAVSEPLLGSIGGVVSHVGRLERCHHMPPPPGSLPGRPPSPLELAMLPFQQCRWVSLLDPSHPTPLLVLVSSCSQPDVFSRLQTGSVLVVTNANIWVVTSTKMVYASSSLESTVCVRVGVGVMWVCPYIWIWWTRHCARADHDHPLVYLLSLQLYLVDEELPLFLWDQAQDLLSWRSTSACTEKLKAYSSELVQVTPPTTPNSLSQLQLLLYQPDTNIEVSTLKTLMAPMNTHTCTRAHTHTHKYIILSSSCR